MGTAQHGRRVGIKHGESKPWDTTVRPELDMRLLLKPSR